MSAAAFFVAAWRWPRDETRVPALLSAGGTVLLFVLLNIEIADFYSRGRMLTFNFFHASLAQDLTYTIGWAIFAVGPLLEWCPHMLSWSDHPSEHDPHSPLRDTQRRRRRG